jgi:hypothetical protein
MLFRWRALTVQLRWDHGPLEPGDEISIVACSTVPGDVDSDAGPPPLFSPPGPNGNNCYTALRPVV